MSTYQQSAKTIRLKVRNLDLTGIPVEVRISRQYGQAAAVVKQTSDASLTLTSAALVGGVMTSVLDCELTDVETANWTGEYVFTIRYQLNGKWWVPEGGIGAIMFTNTVKRS